MEVVIVKIHKTAAFYKPYFGLRCRYKVAGVISSGASLVPSKLVIPRHLTIAGGATQTVAE